MAYRWQGVAHLGGLTLAWPIDGEALGAPGAGACPWHKAHLSFCEPRFVRNGGFRVTQPESVPVSVGMPSRHRRCQRTLDGPCPPVSLPTLAPHPRGSRPLLRTILVRDESRVKVYGAGARIAHTECPVQSLALRMLVKITRGEGRIEATQG